MARTALNYRTSNLIVALCLALSCIASCSNKGNFGKKRAQMISWLKWHEITNENVLKTLSTVPRHEFVLPEYKDRAYEDAEIPIGFDQTLNRPIEDAYILAALDPKPTDRVLEVGTGSGYQAALFSNLAAEIYTIEIVPELAEQARNRLLRLRFNNVYVHTGDGYFGWPDHAPFDIVYMTCSPPKIPQPLIDQLTAGGKLLAPIGGEGRFQNWVLFTKEAGSLKKVRQLSSAQFVPMEGEAKKKK